MGRRKGPVAFWLVAGLQVADAPNWGIDIRGAEENHSHDFIILNNSILDNGLDGEKSGIFTAFVDDNPYRGQRELRQRRARHLPLAIVATVLFVRGNRLLSNNNCGLHINGDLEQGEDGIISDGLIENNVISENGEGGCAGINFDGVTDVIVRNNLLTENHAGGIAIFQQNGAVCSQNIQVINNTIVQAQDGRWAINISDEGLVSTISSLTTSFSPRMIGAGSILIPSSGISGFESDYNVIMDRFSADDDNSVISLSEWQGLGYDANSIIAAPHDLFASSERISPTRRKFGRGCWAHYS